MSVIIFNLSWFSSIPDEQVKILSHRGVHQTFHIEGLTNTTCTAERIYEPTHEYIENTIPSISAAFSYGADMVEIDLRRTADNDFAVFHDHMLECRTNATGLVSDYNMTDLRALDIGYGYTADGGQTFPLRGKGLGLMVNFEELLREFPDKAFQINIKSNSSSDAEIFHDYLQNAGLSLSEDTRIWSGPRFAARWRDLNQSTLVSTRRETKLCAQDYILLGWTGSIPEACDQFGLVVPQNLTWLYWGWPRKTVHRFDGKNLPVFLIGSLNGAYQNIDTPEQAAKVPDDYRGWIITDRIETIGPIIKNKN